jgi:hypothetical protein
LRARWHVAVEERQAFPAEDFFDEVGHSAGALHVPLVVEERGAFGAGQEHRFAAEHVSAEDRAVGFGVLGGEAELVLEEGERLANQGQSALAGRERFFVHAREARAPNGSIAQGIERIQVFRNQEKSTPLQGTREQACTEPTPHRAGRDVQLPELALGRLTA